MYKRDKKVDSNAVKLELTPMIDVVFQLLIFFIVTMKEQDIIAHLDVYRPAPDPDAKPMTQPDNMIRIGVFMNGYTLNRRRQSLETMERNLQRLAAISRTQTVLIECAGNSPHARLVAVLNLCTRTGLTNLSVVSL